MIFLKKNRDHCWKKRKRSVAAGARRSCLQQCSADRKPVVVEWAFVFGHLIYECPRKWVQTFCFMFSVRIVTALPFS